MSAGHGRQGYISILRGARQVVCGVMTHYAKCFYICELLCVFVNVASANEVKMYSNTVKGGAVGNTIYSKWQKN